MTAVGVSPLLGAADVPEASRALHALAADLLEELDAILPLALHGSDEATRRYVAAYRALADRLLGAARSAFPDRVVTDADGRPAVAGGDGAPSRALVEALEHGAAEAPFTAWTTGRPLGEAVGLELLARVRALAGAAPLPAPADPPPPPEDDLGALRFLRRVRFHLDHPDGEPLLRVMDTFALSKADLGRLFGVSRQAVDGWLRHGVPADRQEKLAAVLAVADLLARKLKADRVAGVARRPAEAYGGATMLELVAADRHRELLASVRASFDWSTAA